MRIRTLVPFSLFALACSAFAFSACGGSDVSVNSGDGGAGGTAYTLDNVCALTGPKVCGIRKGCCDKTFGYDEAGCIAEQKTTCGKDVAEVRAGTMTFDPSNIDACLPKLGALTDKCTLTIDELTEAAQVLKDCHAFAGQVGEGLPCERDSQCKPTTTADAFVSCDKDAHKCHTIRLLPAGANCEIRNDLDALCASGLYCDLALNGTDKRGICKTALALGAACLKVQPLECGFGRYCDDTRHCVVGQPGGASCESAIQCASIACNKSGDAGPGTCKAQESLVKKIECGK